MAGRALRPLHQVTATAQRLGEETLDQRIRYSGADDEVAELARTFDAMLDRLAGAFESQKRFVANASHELRTPLAVMRTEIDVTLSDDEADVAEYRRMAQVVRNASERANGLVDALLVLARSEAQSGRRLVRKVPADLATSVYNALSAVRAEAERLKLEVTTDLEPAPVVGDPSLLDRLAGNLIENAIRYNHLLGKLWLRTEHVDGQARLVVGNTGYEVEPADVPGLFEPFRRGGWERTGSRGSGPGAVDRAGGLRRARRHGLGGGPAGRRAGGHRVAAGAPTRPRWWPRRPACPGPRAWASPRPDSGRGPVEPRRSRCRRLRLAAAARRSRTVAGSWPVRRVVDPASASRRLAPAQAARP